MNIDKKTGYSPSNIMRDLLHDNSMLLPAISRFNIAFGFGDNTVKQTCEENNVDVDTLLCVCNLLSGYVYDSSHISLSSLMGYLKRAHESFLEVSLPKIRHYLIDAISYSSSNEVAILLIRFFDEYVEEVRHHMEYENNIIFKYVESLLSGSKDHEFNISEYSESHDDTVSKLNGLKDIFIYHFKQKDNLRLSSALLDIIICEKDLLAHFDVETKLFIPMVEKLEKESKRMITVSKKVCTEKEPELQSVQSPGILSEREKDIIKCIALGKSNKEIADHLFISVHTVTTHRKNISRKLDIHSAAGLTIFAIINHFVDVNEVTPM